METSQSERSTMPTRKRRKSKPAPARKLCVKGSLKDLLNVLDTSEKLKQSFKPDLSQPLHYFAARGHLRTVKELIEVHKCDPECQNQYGVTPLHCASYCGQLGVVKYLIEKQNCCVGIMDEEGASPLDYTAYCVVNDITLKSPLDEFQNLIAPRHDHIRVASFLFLKNKTQIDSAPALVTKVLRLPVFCDSFPGFQELVTMFESYLGNNSKELSNEISSCIEIAMELSKFDFAKSILHTYTSYIKVAINSSGEQSSVSDSNAFHKACMMANLGFIKLFLELDVCRVDAESVKIAIDRNHDQLVLFLLNSSHHPLVMDRCNNGSSLLSHVLSVCKDDHKLVRHIVAATIGVDGVLRDGDGNTALHLACKYSVEYIAKEYSSYQSITNNSLETPLHTACSNHSISLETVKLVSSANVVNDMIDCDGNTPLHALCKSQTLQLSHYFLRHDVYECFKYLVIEKGCDVNIQNSQGELPLHMLLKSYPLYTHSFAIETIEKLMMMLSDKKLNINSQDSDGDTPLHIACKTGYLKAVIYLTCNFECDFNVTNKQGNLPLHLVLSSRMSLEAVKVVSERCTSKHTQNAWEMSPLHVACRELRHRDHKDRDAIKFLELVHDTRCVNIQDCDGNTPLHLACKSGNLEAVLFLACQHNCDVNLVNVQQCLPLHYALKSHMPMDAIRAVSSACSLKHTQMKGNGKTPLHLAMQYYFVKDMELILELVNDSKIINIQDCNGNTPLHLACKSGNLEAVLFLACRQNCDVNLLNLQQCLPLHYALKSHMPLEAIKAVSSACSLKHTQMKGNGKTPLHIACEEVQYSDKDMELVLKLVTDSKSINVQDSDGNTPLHKACKHGNLKAVFFLVQLGCDVNLLNTQQSLALHHAIRSHMPLEAIKVISTDCTMNHIQNDYGKTPLHIACEEAKYFKEAEKVNILAFVYDSRSVNAQDSDENSPLHIACRNDDLDTATYLTSHGQCDLDLPNCEQNLALHYAVEWSTSLEMVKLASNGCKQIHMQNNVRRTPLHIACNLKKLDVVKCLVFEIKLFERPFKTDIYFDLDIRLACKEEANIALLTALANEKNVNRKFNSGRRRARGRHLYWYYSNNDDASAPILVACIYDNISAIKVLLQLKCDLLCQDTQGRLPLHIACSKSLGSVKMLVSCIGDNNLNTHDRNGDTPLHIAIRENRSDIAEFLICGKITCDVNVHNNRDELPLHLACAASNLTLVRLLMEGSNTNALTNSGDSPLHIACRLGELNIVKCLVETCKPSMKVRNKEGMLPVDYAYEHSLEMVKLVSQSCTVEDLTSQEYYTRNRKFFYSVKVTSLDIACISGSLDSVKYLICEKGCSLSALGNNYSALGYACGLLCDDNPQVAILQFLIAECGYDPGAFIEHHSPLMHACQCNDLELMKVLTLHSVNIVDSEGNTPLHYACKCKCLEIARFLINCGCNQKIQNLKGELALHIACSFSLEITQLLTKCDINTLNADQNTALHVACDYKEEEIISYLLDVARCDVNIQNAYGEYALHIACRRSLMIESLVYKSDINCQDADGNTPLHDSCCYRDYKMIVYLLDHQCRADIPNHNGDFALHIFMKPDTTDIDGYDTYSTSESDEESLKNRSHITKLLLNMYNAATITSNHDGLTPVDFAIISGEIELLEVLFSMSEINLNQLLHTACKHGQPHIVRWLIDHGACSEILNGSLPQHLCFQNYGNDCFDSLKELHVNIDHVQVQNEDGDTVLHLACRRERKDVLELMLESIPNLSDCFEIRNNTNADTPLHILADTRAYYDFNSLSPQMLAKIECNNPNMKNNLGNTPLHLACHNEQLNLVEHLVSNLKCDKNIRNNDGYLPLHKAAGKSLKLVRLVATEENVNEKCTNDLGNTLLHLACHNEQLNLVEHLVINLKCDKNIWNNEGYLPLHIAAGKSLKLVRLVATEENVNEKCTNDDSTPLHIACRRRHVEVVDHLLSFYCDCNIPNKEGNTPLHEAAASESLELTKRVGCPENIDKQNKDGNTALHIACKLHSNEIIMYLIDELHCSVEILNNNSDSAFHLLLESEHHNPWKPVLSYIPKSLCDKPNCTGDTLLHLACCRKNKRIVSFLVESMGCNVNVLNTHSGALPLHYACDTGILEIVKLVSSANPISHIKKTEGVLVNFNFVSGDTPLHVACRTGNVDIVEHLLKCGHSEALKCCNELRELPVHVSYYQKGRDQLYELLISYKEYYDCNAVDNSGDSLLHIVCRNNLCSKHVLHLLQKLKCKIDVINKDRNLPLHIACQNKTLCQSVITRLSKGLSDDMLKLPNINGNTALHELVKCAHTKYKIGDISYVVQTFIGRGVLTDKNDTGNQCIKLACRHQKLDVVKYLIEQYGTSSLAIPPSVLYEACLNNNEGVLEYILERYEDVVNIPDQNGDLPLHLATRTKVCERGTIALIKKTVNINHKNLQEDTPFHELYKNLKEDHTPFVYISHKSFSITAVLLAFLDSDDLDLSVQNAEGQTPLHCMCVARRYHDLKTVLGQKKIDANIKDKKGATLLHFACQSNNHDVVSFLVKSAEVDPSIQDNQGQSPISLSTDPDIIKLLTEYGADPKPLYAMHKSFFESKLSPQTPVKLLVIGYASVGKTTLIQSLKNELSDEVITQVFNCTAGIVPTNFSSKVYGDVTFYDFAGQPEYYASHDAVIHSTIRNVPPVILLVVNLNESNTIILNQTRYWIDFMANRCAELTCGAAHMIIIGSHADVLENKQKSPSEKLSQLAQPVKSQIHNKGISLKGILYLNCTRACSNEMAKLQQLLQESTNELRDKGAMNFNSHCFYVFILQIFKSSNFVILGCVLKTLRSRSKDSKSSPLFVLPMDRSAVIDMCCDLDEKGYIMFIKHPSVIDMSWLVLDKAPFLHELSGSLFAPNSADFPQHCPLSYSTGVIPFSRFDEQFSSKLNYPTALSLNFLSRMEYCREIKDKVVLKSIVNGEDFSDNERYYFFPNLVSLDRPENKWCTDSKFSYKFGWIIQCKEEGELFNPHFIQVLLLRLAFSFTPKKVADDSKAFETYSDNTESKNAVSRIKQVVIERLCSVWKNGIYWQEETGVKSIVEILHQSTLVLLMQCLRGCEIELIKRRSLIMSMVLKTKDEFCSKAVLREYFLHPKCVMHPLPDNLSHIQSWLFSLQQVVKTISGRKSCVLNENDAQVKLEDLLYFEPYSHLRSECNLIPNESLEKLSIFCGREPPPGCGETLSKSSEPRLHQLDLIEGNGKTVSLIQSAAASWKRLATRLHFEHNHIRRIERDAHFQSREACWQVCSEWLDGAWRKPINWETLITALNEAELSELAKDLKIIINF